MQVCNNLSIKFTQIPGNAHNKNVLQFSDLNGVLISL